MTPGPEPLPEVVVCLGTDHHPFDRLVDWVSVLAQERWANWFVQYGETAVPRTTPGLESASLLGLAQLRERMCGAGAVVTHGGPGLILDARLCGHRPVVVARDPERGEHVDAHQQRFVRRIRTDGSITTAETLDQFRGAVQAALASGPHTGAALSDASDVAVRRFGSLVEEMLRRSGQR